MSLRPRRAGIALAMAAAVVPVAAAVAGGGKQPVKLNRADQARARAVVVHRADLRNSAWKGGMVKFDFSPGPTCPSLHPKLSDLVITGAAASEFGREGAAVASQGQILRTAT